jgi:hypothetical protein
MGVFDPIIELSKGLGETLALLPFARSPLPTSIPKRSARFVRASADAMS